MAITTYSELQTAVANWLERDDLTSRIPEFIALAESRMNRKLRLRQQVTRATADVADTYSAVPTDFLEPIAAKVGDYDLTISTQGALSRLASGVTTEGRPTHYAVVDGEIRYFPSPDTTYSVELTYFAKIPALSASVTTNWLLSLAPDAYLHGAITEAAVYLRDGELAAAAKALFEEALADLKRSNRVPGGKLRTEVADVGVRHTYDFTTDT